MTPGRAGWWAVLGVVAVADGYAKYRQRQGDLPVAAPTMSDDFARHFGVGVVGLASVAAHLLTHNRCPLKEPAR